MFFLKLNLLLKWATVWAMYVCMHFAVCFYNIFKIREIFTASTWLPKTGISGHPNETVTAVIGPTQTSFF